MNPEVAVVFSAGGFSDKFPRPAYQDNAVSAYLKTLGNQFSGLYNVTGRGFPDVAAQSFNITFATEGQIGGFAGTRFVRLNHHFYYVSWTDIVQCWLTNVSRSHRNDECRADRTKQSAVGFPKPLAIRRRSCWHD